MRIEIVSLEELLGLLSPMTDAERKEAELADARRAVRYWSAAESGAADVLTECSRLAAEANRRLAELEGAAPGPKILAGDRVVHHRTGDRGWAVLVDDSDRIFSEEDHRIVLWDGAIELTEDVKADLHRVDPRDWSPEERGARKDRMGVGGELLVMADECDEEPDREVADSETKG